MSTTLDLCRAVLASSLTEERRPEAMRVHRQALAEATRLATTRERERHAPLRAAVASILALLEEDRPVFLRLGGSLANELAAAVSHAVEET